MTQRPTNAIILVPEITKGMKSIGSKALLKTARGISVLDYQILYLRKHYPQLQICVATGFEHEKIKKKTISNNSTTYLVNKDYGCTNHGRSIELYIKQHNPENLLVITGGVLLKNRLPTPKISTIYAIKRPKSGFTIGFNETSDIDKVGIHYLFYDLPTPWVECVYLTSEAILRLRDLCLKHNLQQLFLFEIINLLLDNHIVLDYKFIDNKNVIKINNSKDISKIKNFYDKTIYAKR